MKRAVILLSALFLFAGLTFAQEPQKPVKKSDPVKTEQTKSTSKDCPQAKKCSKVKAKHKCSHQHHAKPAKKDPEEK